MKRTLVALFMLFSLLTLLLSRAGAQYTNLVFSPQGLLFYDGFTAAEHLGSLPTALGAVGNGWIDPGSKYKVVAPHDLVAPSAGNFAPLLRPAVTGNNLRVTMGVGPALGTASSTYAVIQYVDANNYVLAGWNVSNNDTVSLQVIAVAAAQAGGAQQSYANVITASYRPDASYAVRVTRALSPGASLTVLVELIDTTHNVIQATTTQTFNPSLVGGNDALLYGSAGQVGVMTQPTAPTATDISNFMLENMDVTLTGSPLALAPTGVNQTMTLGSGGSGETGASAWLTAPPNWTLINNGTCAASFVSRDAPTSDSIDVVHINPGTIPGTFVLKDTVSGVTGTFYVFTQATSATPLILTYTGPTTLQAGVAYPAAGPFTLSLPAGVATNGTIPLTPALSGTGATFDDAFNAAITLTIPSYTLGWSQSFYLIPNNSAPNNQTLTKNLTVNSASWLTDPAPLALTITPSPLTPAAPVITVGDGSVSFVTSTISVTNSSVGPYAFTLYRSLAAFYVGDGSGYVSVATGTGATSVTSVTLTDNGTGGQPAPVNGTQYFYRIGIVDGAVGGASNVYASLMYFAQPHKTITVLMAGDSEMFGQNPASIPNLKAELYVSGNPDGIPATGQPINVNIGGTQTPGFITASQVVALASAQQFPNNWTVPTGFAESVRLLTGGALWVNAINCGVSGSRSDQWRSDSTEGYLIKYALANPTAVAALLWLGVNDSANNTSQTPKIPMLTAAQRSANLANMVAYLVGVHGLKVQINSPNIRNNTAAGADAWAKNLYTYQAADVALVTSLQSTYPAIGGIPQVALGDQKAFAYFAGNIGLTPNAVSADGVHFNQGPSQQIAREMAVKFIANFYPQYAPGTSSIPGRRGIH